MIVRHPPATISLTPHELAEAVQAYLLSKGVLEGKRTGNLIATDLVTQVSITGRSLLAGHLTFELLPEGE